VPDLSGAQSIGDAPSGQVVGRQLNTHTITRQDANKVHPETTGYVRQHLVTAIKLNTKHRVRQRFGYFALDFDDIFFRQSTPVEKHDQFARHWRATTANYTTKLLIYGQQPGTVIGNQNCMLKVCGLAAIFNNHRPIIIQDGRFR